MREINVSGLMDIWLEYSIAVASYHLERDDRAKRELEIIARCYWSAFRSACRMINVNHNETIPILKSVWRALCKYKYPYTPRL